MKQSVRISCDLKDRIDIDDLVEFQGDLKDLSDESYEKLKNEILETGFAFPVFIWKDPRPKEKKKIIGGHQRVKALRKMRDEGISVPEIPFVLVHARDEIEAKRRVLQDVSQYGKVSNQGLSDFLETAQIKIDDVMKSFVIPDLDMSAFTSAYFPRETSVSFTAKVGSKELKEEEFQEFDHSCPKCSFSFDCDKQKK